MESLVLPLRWDPGVLSCTLYRWHLFLILCLLLFFNTKRKKKKPPGLCGVKSGGWQGARCGGGVAPLPGRL